MKRRKFQRFLHEEVGLQIAPMIDVTMLLLFFFMLSTTLEHRRNRQRIELPVTKIAVDSEPNESPVVICISAGGSIELNGSATTLENVGSAISSHNNGGVKQRPMVEIRADSTTASATIKKLISVITRAGAQDVSYVICNK